jgi:hypothetical protein
VALLPICLVDCSRAVLGKQGSGPTDTLAVTQLRVPWVSSVSFLPYGLICSLLG